MVLRCEQGGDPLGVKRCRRSHARTSLLGTVRTGCRPSTTACSVTIAPSVAGLLHRARRSGSPPCARPWRARMRSTVDGETHPPFQIPAAVSELAMRQIDLAPLLEQLDHAASPHSRMQWIGLPPGGWSSRRLVVRRCCQRRTRCRSSLSVGPLWLRVPSHRTGIRPARDRLSTRTRCRPDSALSDALVGGRSTVGRCHRSPTRAVFRGLANTRRRSNFVTRRSVVADSGGRSRLSILRRHPGRTRPISAPDAGLDPLDRTVWSRA